MMACSACGAKFEYTADGACPSCGARFDNLPQTGASAPLAVPTPVQGMPAAPGVMSAGPAYTPASPEGVTPGSGSPEARAGFWIRLAAQVIDLVLLSMAKGLTIAAGVKGAGGLLAMPLINGLYFIGLTANGGQTLGKKILGIKVVMMDGSAVSLGKAALRWVGYLLSALPLYMGYIWVGATKPKRGWHDLIAGTKVVYADPAVAARGLVYTPEDEKTNKTALFICLGIFLLFVGVLAAIAIPAFSGLMRHGNEGTSKGNLGSIRSALSIYYGDMEGAYPSKLEALTVGSKYMQSLPKAKAPRHHRDSNQVHAFPSRSQASGSDTGGWAYIDNPSDPDFGSVWVNCSHTDTRGSVWNAY